MGLEAINLLFQSKGNIEPLLTSGTFIKHIEGRKYVFSKTKEYWIDVEILDSHSASIRIALCNPVDNVLSALTDLLSLFFTLDKGALTDIGTKRKYDSLSELTLEEIKLSYLKRKKVFEEMYGKFTAAIGSDEFYKLQQDTNLGKQ